MISKEIHLINRPKGLPKDNDFAGAAGLLHLIVKKYG